MFEPYGVTIFCDDIRSEIGGKHTLVGVYGSNLIIKKAKPAILPLISVAATIVIPNEFKATTMIYRLKRYKTEDDLGSDDYEILVESKRELKNKPITPGRVSREVEMFSLSQLQVEDDCLLASRAYFEDLEVKLGVLIVKFRPDKSNAASSPSKRAKPGD
ncbi:hypothetical protein RB623_15850 [Mesorhizobium sp. LHD-90]|uniref:hypothetical protein n=1 Tax=Mesorhizobium sp. LHD-90 TaxID=3071414 RepID=UPI0027E13988|nr:hypothetical protein [Mesorhizobium sp. LHD-90]MDQ6435531.1 hypothetical protein [Mesorhizobium sp. LHD-90]